MVPHVLVLACASKARALDGELLRACADIVDREAAPIWLDEGVAAEIASPAPLALDQAALLARVREVLAGAPVDLAIVPARERRKLLLLADMDSTMIEQECVDELAARLGLRTEVSAITERAMRGEIAFEPALRERVALLKGMPVAIVDEVLSRITLSPGARTLVRTMRAHGAHCCLVSGGFTLFAAPLAEKLGFHEHRANRLVLCQEHLAGEVEEPILGRDAKRDALRQLRERLSLPHKAVLAVGDGANDLAMLAEAGWGVAYRAKPAVAAAAPFRIDHADLTALLYLQGYRREEFQE
ncbi:MAG: phosphoserine phosphatase SerB [Hyphomicrobiales bacterium]|nr:phosphoserine phosphatase SerB [Hyphomicrobiales bacterium]